MSAHPISDRPFLRLYEESAPSSQPWTMRRVFDELRWPEMRFKRSANDCQRWIRCWEEFEAEVSLLRPVSQTNSPTEGPGQRTISPLSCSEVSSRDLRAFQLWLAERFPLPAGASSINKAVKEIALLLKLACDEGIEVQRITVPKHHKVQSRPRFYFDDSSIERLWKAAEQMDWPPKASKSPRATDFRGTGLEPCDFWRCLIVLLRNYGMRVQDLAAYALKKTPICWQSSSSGVYLHPQSPNHESHESWPLGWIHFIAAKTRESSGRQYYLPLTASARAAVDKLQAAAMELDGKLIGSKPIFQIPRSHGLTEKFAKLQELAGVMTRTGEPFELEDFRKTVATYAAPVNAELPDALCGWDGSASVKRKHYQNPEVLLVRQLHRVPMPSCFDQWIQPSYSKQIADHVATLS